MLANALKITAVAAVLGLGGMAASATSASADTYKTRCHGDDCVRLQCDDWGGNCLRIGYFDRAAPPVARPYEYSRTYTYYGRPDSDSDYYYESGPYYHYDNHFDSDYDYDDYPG